MKFTNRNAIIRFVNLFKEMPYTHNYKPISHTQHIQIETTTTHSTANYLQIAQILSFWWGQFWVLTVEWEAMF